MVGNLSEILKYALDSPDKEVSLRQEIQYTKHYLQIQSMRHENRFAVQWQYTPDVLDIPTIRLIIQPLVENCIYHATEKTDRKVAIKIALRIRHGRLRIAVIDNGQGMSAQMLRRLREIPLRNEPEEPGAHIGLYNTVKRLQLKYNCANPFSIRSRPGRGTFVRLDIPLAEPKAEARATVEQACKT
jgi:two-component system sensor histidine kinase YesM